MAKVILDISRLISRVRHSTPSGVDRVEMAYARGLLHICQNDLAFAAVHPAGFYGRIDHSVALAYLDELEARWRTSDGSARQRSLVSILPWMTRLMPRSRPRRAADIQYGPASGNRPVYVQASPHHLTNQGLVRRILEREQAGLLCLVHDLIPIEYPEYARPGGDRLHHRRMDTLAACADAVIVNSAATGRSFQPWIEGSGRSISLQVAPLGTEALPTAAVAPPPEDRPYFVCIGTIEGRKNHILLLHLWRQMAQTMPSEKIPRLVLIGRRGWENEQVLDLLDRSPALLGHVEEISGCPDTRLSALLRGARALLMPSFAEGFGMPVAEALSVGVPVICSDIPAHHEVGGAVPDYADPLDGPAWQDLVLDHAAKGAAWQAQTARLQSWRKPTWSEHLQIVAGTISAVAQGR